MDKVALAQRGHSENARVSRTAYFDCHASTAVDPAVLAIMSGITEENPANAGSRTHVFGREAANVIDRNREAVASTIGARADEIIFTSGATESCNIAVCGLQDSLSGGGHIVLTSIEHPAVRDATRALLHLGAEVTVVAVNGDGIVCPEEIARAIRPNTVLVSAMFANNEVGTLSPVKEIGAVCREAGVLFHTDATQAVGKVSIDLSRLQVDLMSFSAHKIYGPKGVGALYVNRQTAAGRLKPIMYGGGHEQGLRPGTLPVPLIAGFGKACELSTELMVRDAKRIGLMRDRLWQRIQSEIPNAVLNGHPTLRLYNNLNVSFLGVPSEAFLVKLRDVVAVSAGSACTSANPEPSHVLRAMGIYGERLDSAIRFGLGRFNTMEEIEHVADHIRDAVAELRCFM
jgi:cysteine desulfurase